MIRLTGKRLAAVTLLLQLAVLCTFFAALALLFNFETVILAPWCYLAALGAGVLALDIGALFLVFRCGI